VHLGARTDLGETEDIQGYDANIQGVKNLIDAINATPSVTRVLFASSMLVCKFGYRPQSDNDYCPDTLYGQSKVKTENIIRQTKLSAEWAIIRPTSIWGPWFAEPYLNFFQMIVAGRFVHPGRKAGNATFG
jgi:nucleoside-diphosphate-sugar epimerase